MRKITVLSLAILLVCAFALCGCLGSNKPTNPTQPIEPTEPQVEFTMVAEIIGIAEDHFLVRRVVATGYFDGPIQLEVPIINLDAAIEPKVGDIITITYTGLIVDTMPARIHEVLKIEEVGRFQPAIPTIPTLEEIGRYENIDLNTLLVGLTEDMLIEAWGHWDGCLSGLRGDIWHVNKGDPNSKKILVYYKQNESGEWIVQSAGFMKPNNEPVEFVHVYDGEGCGGEFVILLSSDGTFQYYEGPLSSYAGIGSWTIDENNIICMKDDPVKAIDGEEFVRTNYFYSIGNTMTWIAEGSDGFLYVDLEDGANFPCRFED